MKETEVTAKAVANLTKRDVALDVLELEKECVRVQEARPCDRSCRTQRVAWPSWYCPLVEDAVRSRESR